MIVIQPVEPLSRFNPVNYPIKAKQMTILFAQNLTGNTPLITNHLQNDGFIVIFLDKNVDTLQQAQMQHADIIITDLLSAKAPLA